MSSLPWHAIKIPLLLLFAVVLLAGTGVWWSSGKLVEAETARARQTQASLAAQLKLQRSNTEKQLIQQYMGTYQALVARGFVGAENRLAWLEAVHQANRDAALYGLDYSLAPRTLVSSAPGKTPSLNPTSIAAPLEQSAAALPLGQTEMTVRMPILVEDDLTHFLDALQQRTQSIFRVRMCQISRAADTAPQPLNSPQLEVECELLWFTVADKGALKS